MLDEKKKVMIVAALGVVILGIGAFQFMPGGAPAASPAPKKRMVLPGSTAPAAPEIVLNPPLLAARDPFEVPASQDSAPTGPTVNGAPVTGAEAPAATPHVRRTGKRFPTLPGNISPLPVGGAEVMPDPSRVSGLRSELSAAKPAPAPEPEFGYHLAGVMLGVKPIAVFMDKAGAQKLVSIGGNIDGDAKLESLSRAGATVTFRGKTLRLEMGGDPIAK